MQHDLEHDDQQPTAKKRQRAAPASLGKWSLFLVLAQQVDLDVFLAALLARRLLALAQALLLMTRPRQVRKGP
jgi:hypothetical protein